MSRGILLRSMRSHCSNQKPADVRARFVIMKKLTLLLALMLMFPLAWAKEAAPVAEDPDIERRMVALSEDLRCLVCQNETIAASRADFANDLRRESREHLKADQTRKEIVYFLVGR